ncbi:MAG: hypothetical protein LUD50_03655 [Clostridia bacterium]|nr:hypothetical protein [Clostridia bacterium]
MMNMIKKQTLFGWLSCAAGVLSLVALIIYCVNSSTGYYSATSTNALPIVFAVIAVILLIGGPIVADKMDSRIPVVFVLAAAVLMSAAACIYILERVPLFADMWFIPTTPPASELAAFGPSMAGIIFYFLSAIVAVVACFGKLNKTTAHAAEATSTEA